MYRRNFIKSLTALSLISPLQGFAFQTDKKQAAIIKPPRLKKGDTIGLIAPGSFIKESELQESIENLKALGYNPVYSKNILARSGYLAGTDSERLEDFNEMLLRRDVNAIMCARGGYGCARILPMIDYEAVKKNPKIIIGYSDVTALLYGIFTRSGLVCFHGPVGISTFNDFSKYNFTNVLTEPSESFTLYSARDENPGDQSRKVTTIRCGKAEGILAGGNLSIVVSLIGTAYDIDMTDKIIFLEEIGEEPYRIDRMLTQMTEAGKFDKAAGIALGVFEKCEAKETENSLSSSFTLMEVLYDRLFKLGIPVIYGLSFGHVTNKFTLPVGIRARLDADNQVITLLESAVA